VQAAMLLMLLVDVAGAVVAGGNGGKLEHW